MSISPGSESSRRANSASMPGADRTCCCCRFGGRQSPMLARSCRGSPILVKLFLFAEEGRKRRQSSSTQLFPPLSSPSRPAGLCLAPCLQPIVSLDRTRGEHHRGRHARFNLSFSTDGASYERPEMSPRSESSTWRIVVATKEGE